MKIYISLPITNNVEACKARVASISKQLVQKGHEVVSPFDISPGTKRSYAYYISRDIQALLGCDAIFLLSGWSESQSCNLEWRCAQIYNKNIYQHINDIPHATK